MARNIVGRWLLEFGEGTLQRIPLAGSVYKTLKQLLETFLRDNSTRFRRVVLVEYPREGLYSVGFVTGVVGPSLQAELQEPLLSVFIPTAPNPTTGWYTLVPETSVRGSISRWRMPSAPLFPLASSIPMSARPR